MLLEFPDALVRSLFSRPSAFYRPSGPRAEIKGGDVPRDGITDHGPLLHAAVGISGESGELLDCIKKAWAYGQPLNRENLYEELGDIAFYWLAACMEGGVHPQKVIDQMVTKLQKRYPAGEFNAADAAERKDKA
jgi:NTP pyrophosphatase (non-canonical NTP hydrolase)